MKKKYDSIEEMKKVIVKYNIPIKNNEYFVKKALNELQKIRRKGERLWQISEIQQYQKQ